MNQFFSAFAPDIEAFLDLKEAFGHERKSTESFLKKFDRYCAEHYSDATLLSREMAVKWLAIEAETSQTKYHASIIRQFGKYQSAMGKESFVLPDHFVLGESKFTPYIMTELELSSFFQAVDSLNYSACNPRAHLIAPVLFRLLYTCGLRPGEAREIKTTDVNLHTGEIMIRQNKQHKERIVVMSDDMRNLCVQYDEKRQRFRTDGAYFFPADGDKPYNATRFKRLCKSCWRKANPGVKKENLPPLRPYDFRHSFASSVVHKWLDEGKSMDSMLPYLRAYLGHVTFNSTIYYVHLLPENLEKSAGIDLSVFNNLLPEVCE